MEQQEHDIITRMNDQYMKMSKGHKAIAAYISDHYEQAVFMTAAKLGETVGVSESTVVRFAAGLGYEGYPEFQDALQDWVKNKLNSVQKIGAKYGKSTQSEILHSVLNSDIEKIQDTIVNLDAIAFEAAVDIILE
ncbi:MAG: MurR/RpiR family transcriptional regulator, partial [Lachnospiraceae bacterium]|nr:MurR/RpiR family transcriptional regulator [Lachnospiraceae bacterium]